MKRYTLILALIATIILSSCSLCNNTEKGKTDNSNTTITGNKVVDKTKTETNSFNNSNNSEYTADELALLNEDGIVAYVDKSCNIDVCKEDFIKSIVNNQILQGTSTDIKIVPMTMDIWNVFKKTMSGSPILSLDKKTMDTMIAKDPRVKQYINMIGDRGFLSLGGWALGEENICDDGIDNNGDGKIDLKDPTCSSIAILYDSRCTDGKLCDIKNLEAGLKQQTFNLGFAMSTIDYTTEEGKSLYNIVGGKLPTILASGLKSDIKKALEEQNLLKDIKAGNYRYQVTFLPSIWDPTGEICDNNIDDDGNGKTDCEDSNCSKTKQCREEKKAQLDVFLMGYCPFGEIAAKQIPLLKDALNNNFKLGIHFIANKTGEGNTANDFESLHGIPEAEEDIRQLCIQKYSGTDKLVEYMQKRYENADNYGRISDKPSVALESIGADVDAINSCIKNGEGGKLLAEDIKLAQELGIGASPTWFANNRHDFGGIDANGIKTEFCKYNPEIKECNDGKIIDTGNNTTEGGGPSCGK